MIEDKMDMEYEEMSNKQRVCHLLCSRSSGDCKSDMGLICSEYSSSSFEDLSKEFRVNDFDPDVWEIEEGGKEDICEDCDKQINIKVSSKSK